MRSSPAHFRCLAWGLVPLRGLTLGAVVIGLGQLFATGAFAACGDYVLVRGAHPPGSQAGGGNHAMAGSTATEFEAFDASQRDLGGKNPLDPLPPWGPAGGCHGPECRGRGFPFAPVPAVRDVPPPLDAASGFLSAPPAPHAAWVQPTPALMHSQAHPGALLRPPS